MAESLSTRQFAAGSCYSYIVSSGTEAVVVDPHISLRDEYTRRLRAQGLSLVGIVDTHTHADHFSLAAILKKEFKAPVIMHEKAVSKVADRRVKDGDEIRVGGGSLSVIYSPGHTDDAISLVGGGRVFTGDVLLIASVGRTDFQNGSPALMFDSLQRIKALPGETLLCPGHDYHGKRSSTIAAEKESNPYVRETSRDAFVRTVTAKPIPKPFNIDNIIRVNREGEAAEFVMIAPREAHDLAARDAKTRLLDVRSVAEFTHERIAGAVNVPIDMLAAKAEELAGTGDRYIVFCRTGNRSPMAADMLIQSGVQGVKVMDGGMTRWKKERLPFVKGEGGMSLEQQVRLIAGSLVLLGIVLSRLVHPWFIGIALFFACGLIYAGITDNCMMGMILMKLPYNRKKYQAKHGGGTCAAS